MIEEKNEKDLVEECTFSDFDLKQDILDAIKAIGYIKPTDIQREAIPKVLEGVDVVGLAQTGTGKTAAFGLPSLSNISEEKVVQSLVICPTRELAKQIQEEYKKFLSNIRSINAACVYGGEERYKQKKLMKKLRPQIIIGTPGRIIDFINDGAIDLKNINSVILDEADEMLNMGFIDDIRRILSETPKERQTLLFSATMPKEIERIVTDFQKDPEVVRIKRVSRTADTIEQTYYYVDRTQKSDLLIRILDYTVPNSCIIFCNTKAQVDDLNIYLKQNMVLADTLHGDLKQQQRDRVMKAFKDTKTHVLI